MIITALAALAALNPAAAPADTDPVAAYIDAGFAAMDLNADGRVERAEFDRFMRDRLGRQREEFEAAFAAFDKNGDGQISKAEARANKALAENFASIDADGSGGISTDEIRSALVAAQAGSIAAR